MTEVYRPLHGPVRLDCEDVQFARDHRDDLWMALDEIARWIEGWFAAEGYEVRDRYSLLEIELYTLSQLTDEELRDLYDSRFETGSQDPNIYPWEMAIVYEATSRMADRHEEELVKEGYLLEVS